MKRRDFIKYSAVTGSTFVFPQLLNASWTWNDTEKAIKAAFYASKLNPVRLFSGLIFDEIAEVYVEPLAKQAFHSFVSGVSISKSSLAYHDSSSILEAKTIEHEPYKASVVVYGVADYELYRQKQINLQLKRHYDKQRFAQINQYLKDEKVKLKLYNRDTTFRVGSDLEPNELFNIDYLTFGGKVSDKKIHIEELLKLTDNSAFKEVVA
jgi:hypothetical protein